MLSGATASAFAMAGTAVFRIVVSSDSMKKATATSHGNKRFTDSPRDTGGKETTLELAGITRMTVNLFVTGHQPQISEIEHHNGFRSGSSKAICRISFLPAISIAFS